MLSPNARKRVADSRGTGRTVTLNVHELVRARASVAAHVTAVSPTGKVDPGAGVQLTETGALPPCATGTGNCTCIGPSSRDSATSADGHTNVGPGSGVGAGGADGAAGLAPQPASQTVPRSRVRAWRRVNGGAPENTRRDGRPQTG